MLAEVRSTVKVDIRRLCERRIRRLGPALVAVIGATGVIGRPDRRGALWRPLVRVGEISCGLYARRGTVTVRF